VAKKNHQGSQDESLVSLDSLVTSDTLNKKELPNPSSSTLNQSRSSPVQINAIFAKASDISLEAVIGIKLRICFSSSLFLGFQYGKTTFSFTPITAQTDDMGASETSFSKASQAHYKNLKGSPPAFFTTHPHPLANYLYNVSLENGWGNMRQIIISDTHTLESIDKVYEYTKRLLEKMPVDSIVINGDLLGMHEVKKDYGYGFDRKEFLSSLDKKAMLERAVPGLAAELMQKAVRIKDDPSEEVLEEFGKTVSSYLEVRYDFVLSTLRRFINLSRVYFNLGNHESPLRYLALKELAFLLDMDEAVVRRAVLYTSYRDVYNRFKEKMQALEGKGFKYIGGRAVLDKDTLIAGIPGLAESSVPTDSASELQEKVTNDLLDSIRRQLSYAQKLIIYNHCEGRVTKEPFTFRPGSAGVRQFIQDMKGKLKHKVFVQSHYHWLTTHFYTRDEFQFILNNAGVNNGLFNVVEIGGKVRCFDVDPEQSRVLELKSYDSYIADYSNPSQRLALNYPEPEKIMRDRALGNCYYM